MFSPSLSIFSFEWPAEIGNNGCPVLYDPIVTQSGSSLYLMFDGTIDQVMVEVDLASEYKIVRKWLHSDPFFVGFENMGIDAAHALVYGLSGTATQSGICSDGCYQFGELALNDARYAALQNVPFKAVTDDAHFLDVDAKRYYVQLSHDLRSAPCAPGQADNCMCAIDVSSGALESCTFTNWTVYGYSPARQSSGSLVVWMYGFEERCSDPYNDFLFAKLDPTLTAAVPIACIQHNATIDEDEWIESFSLDNTLFATGSGDAEAGRMQLLVFDIATGKAVVDTFLPGLAAALKSAEGMVMVWGVSFV